MITDHQGICYEINDQLHTVRIVFSANAKGDILIQRSIIHKSNVYEITDISEESFQNSQISSVSFAEDSIINTIPKNLFAFSSIQKLHLSPSIQKLEEGWCSQAKYLINITISPKNKYFQNYDNQLLLGKSNEREEHFDIVYFASRNIESVLIPEKIKIINSYSFEFCQKLKKILFMENNKLLTIGKFAFSNSTIESISIPNNVTNIESSAFFQCKQIKSFELDEKLQIISNNDDTLESDCLSDFLDNLMQYKTKISQIDDNIIKKMYSMFSFKFYKVNEQTDNQLLISKLFLYLKKFKVITYYFCNLVQKDDVIRIDFNISSKTNCIFCYENECLIIEHIDTKIIDDLINKLKNQQIILINVSKKSNEQEIKEEIFNFCNNDRIINYIKKNYFVKYTIHPIIGYLIRRHYFPTYYFSNSSFFNFDLLEGSLNSNNNSSNDDKDSKNPICEFHKKDFIKIRNIYSYNDTIYDLMVHVNTFYLFVIKYYQETTMKHEKKFCEYSHQCFTRFYGFLKDGEQIIGLVYEFMCNGSLELFLKKNETDDMYLLMTIIRISDGIYYLHQNGLIHRDLKPSNILVDHNHFPYISDFETIRSTNLSEGKFTNNIGSQFYSSPEQDNGGNISYATDIYSFGLIIYYLYEKKHMLSNCSKDKAIPMEKGPDYMNYLYQNCVQFKPEYRTNIKNIKKILRKNFEKINNFYHQYMQNGNKKVYMQAKEYYEQLLRKEYILIDSFSIEDSENEQYVKYLFTNILKHQIKSNESHILNLLGYVYEKGIGVKQDYSKAMKYYEQSEKLNNSNAFNILGYLYEKGIGVKQDYSQAIKYYKQSANLNYSDAFNILGYLYGKGIGVKQDYSQSINYFKQSAKLNNSKAYFILGYHYEKGIGVKQDYSQAIRYYEKSANLNNSDALNILGYLYEKGIGVKQDYSQAKKYYEKSVNLNNSNAYFNLGYLYEKGIGVKQDYSQAINYYEQSAKLNNSYALNYLGFMYENGFIIGKNYIRAKDYYEKSANLNDSYGYYHLGRLYEEGFGVKQNYLEAIKYYKQSAQLNNSYALLKLGYFFIMGLGVKINYRKAIMYYEQSAEHNNSYAFFWLGYHCEKGLCVKQDYFQAKKYYEKSAMLNNSEAFLRLGNLYENGQGVDQNYMKALSCFEESSKLNNVLAHFYLGDFYSFYFYQQEAETCFQKSIKYYPCLELSWFLNKYYFSMHK